MKTQLIASLTLTAAVTGALLSSAPAQAFSFGTGGIKFDRDTTVNFTFLKSQGANISRLGVYDSAGKLIQSLFAEKDRADAEYKNDKSGANSWLGTAKNLTGSATASFTFAANTLYSLGLFNQGWSSTWTVFSNSNLNVAGGQRAVFDSIGGAEGKAYKAASVKQSGNPFLAPVAIAFEDIKGGGDRDFNDFVVSAEAVPEPLTMGGLALGGAWLAAARRRRNKQTA